MVILLILAVIGNMYKEGGRRGDKGFVWTGKEPNGAEKITEEREQEKRVGKDSTLKYVAAGEDSTLKDVGVGEDSTLKDVAVGRDPPNIAVVRGEQRYLIDLALDNRQMPELEDAD